MVADPEDFIESIKFSVKRLETPDLSLERLDEISEMIKAGLDGLKVSIKETARLKKEYEDDPL
jgi:hypothetical protein